MATQGGDLMSAGERIRVARKRRGWTQIDLAREVGCSQQTIVDIESKNVASSRFMLKIIHALGESLEWIERGIGSPAGAATDAGRLPHLDLETVALRIQDPGQAVREVGSLYAGPVDMSLLSFTVGVDRMTAMVMVDSVRSDDVLFVDPLAEPLPGRLVLALMPGWHRAELRMLESSGGKHFLGAETDRFGPPLVECTLFRSVDLFRAAAADISPALVVGTVVFIGRDV